MKISIQGYQGSFHELAARKLYKQNLSLLYRDTFSEVFDDVIKNKADLALVAIENSNVGSINEVYDLLLKDSIKIVGEIYMKISHNLIGMKSSKITDIKNVYSHPMALLQCDKFIEKQLPNAQAHERHDTAESVEYISKLKDPSSAAIASKEAAEVFGLSIIKPNIEDDKHNYTRFILLSTKPPVHNRTNKTSIVITTKNTPGALFKVLESFAKRKINLSKIESRPTIGKGWNYYFYIDCEDGINKLESDGVIADLKKQTKKLVILGSYNKGEVIK